MRNIIISIITFAMIVTAVTPASAFYRRHVAHRNNWVGPAIIGGLALGLGSALIYDRYHRRCWIEEQDVVDRRGRYLGTQDVRVCN